MEIFFLFCGDDAMQYSNNWAVSLKPQVYHVIVPSKETVFFIIIVLTCGL